MPPNEWSSVEEAWRRVAESVGGEFQPAIGSAAHGGWAVPTVQKPVGEGLVTLERWRTDSGFRTRMVAPFRNPDGFRWELREEGMLDHFWKTLGFLQDVQVGDEDFDGRYLVKGRPAARVRALLDEEVRALVRRQPGLRLGVGGFPVYGLGLPPGVDALYFTHPAELLDVDRVVALFELFSTLLGRLAPDPGGWRRDPAALRERLLGRGGKVRGASRIVLWDEDRARREAAEALGRIGSADAVPALLSVLGDGDDGLVAAAIGALAAIGDERAVLELARLLGARESRVEGRTLAEHASDALRELDRGDVADAFRAALDGDPEPLVACAPPWREAIVEALMGVVDSADFSARTHAARALGALGAHEALPLLRSKSTAWGMQTRMTEAAAEAVGEIEARASLPRPAAGAPERPDTHPRPAGEPGTDGSTLPRPVEGDDDEPRAS